MRRASSIETIYSPWPASRWCSRAVRRTCRDPAAGDRRRRTRRRENSRGCQRPRRPRRHLRGRRRRSARPHVGRSRPARKLPTTTSNPLPRDRHFRDRASRDRRARGRAPAVPHRRRLAGLNSSEGVRRAHRFRLARGDHRRRRSRSLRSICVSAAAWSERYLFYLAIFFVATAAASAERGSLASRCRSASSWSAF